MDTRTFRSALETHGLAREVSDAIVDLVEDSGKQFVTNDKLELEMTKLRAEFKADMSELRVDLRGEMSELREELKFEMSELRSELRGDMADLKSDLRGDMSDLKSELRGDMSDLRSELRGDMNDMHSELKDDNRSLRLSFANLETRFAEHKLHTTRLVLGTSGGLGVLMIMLRFLPA